MTGRRLFAALLAALPAVAIPSMAGAEEGIAVRTPCHCRPGGPPAVAWYAKPTITPKYCGYYVGGGAPCKGEPRYSDEGTWGWDYRGCSCAPIRVALGWWHGRRYQGGAGAYKIDGLEVPDVPAAVHAEGVNIRAKKNGEH